MSHLKKNTSFVQESVETVEYMQSQTALVAELSLDGRVTDCLLRSYCLVGAHGDTGSQVAKVNIILIKLVKYFIIFIYVSHHWLELLSF